jgi:CBS domain containing-hemolysin-like protein
MLPRIYITALDVITPLPVAVEQLIKSGHSRVPVYEESVDNIIGLLYAKDLLKVWQEGAHRFHPGPAQAGYLRARGQAGG